MIEDEENAIASKLNKKEIEREEEKQKALQDHKEKIRKRNEKDEADKKRIFIIGIIEAVLFAAMIALHITLSVLQSDSTGLNAARTNYLNEIVGTSQSFVPIQDVK